MSKIVTLAEIQKAADALDKVVLRTPTLEAPWLKEETGCHAFLKLENLQITSSFKVRGAYIKLVSLTPEEKQKGVIAMSAGNHAQGVAYHAQQMGIPATIVMPKNTPIAKIESTEKFGCTVVLEGQNLADAALYAIEHAQSEGLSLIHPYDDPDIITGQGTVALEMLEDVPDLERLIIPIGGGGLAAGMAIAAKSLNPKIEIIGVQSASYPAMAQTIYPERSFIKENIFASPLAEGIAVKTPGLMTREILKKNISDILIVTEEQIEDAIEDLLVHGKLVVEGAGAVGVAAVCAYPQLFKARKTGIVICGGNIDSRILSSLLLRGMVHHGKLVRLKIDINDAPGVLGQISKIIGEADGNIYEISHQRLFNHFTVKMAEIDAVVETKSRDHADKIISALQNKGFPTQLVE